MTITTKNFDIITEEKNKSTFIGSMNWPTPLSYETLFITLKEKIKKNNEIYIINLENCEYMDSSGICALAKLLIYARKIDIPILIEINNDPLWQQKEFVSLTKIWDRISIKVSK